MNDLNNIINLHNIELIKNSLTVFFTFYIFSKAICLNKIKIKNKIIIIIFIPIITIISIYAKYQVDAYHEIIIMILFITLINKFTFKNKILYSFFLTIISFSINYIIYIISITIAFILNVFLKVQNDYIELLYIFAIYLIILMNVINLKKFKYGISYLKKKFKETYLNILILNIGIIVLFFAMMIHDKDILKGRAIITTFIILSITMFITIKQSFDLYYKQNLLEKDLKETKDELEAKKKEVEKLEKENLEFSKTSHSLAHKQKALEYRLSQLTKLGKINEDEEIDIKNELENISEEMYKEPEDIELAKTDIPSIDNMFSYMQSECIKDNIKFELQVVGNIHYMVNNLITENELEILIADHIKDAIIAINHSDNSNRSILVRIGKIDNLYSLYIYDSGIEFTKEVLDNLGKKPITTHADTGGTGMGFMNTFDTLNKTKASFIINEIGKPCEDNYTKVLIFKFDNQNEFKVNSYKNEVVV